MTRETIVNKWCDHCGKKIEYNKIEGELPWDCILKGATVEIYDGLSADGDSFDLCDDCAKEHRKFFKRKKNE